MSDSNSARGPRKDHNHDAHSSAFFVPAKTTAAQSFGHGMKTYCRDKQPSGLMSYSLTY